MNYFEAKKALKVLREYKDLTVRYWQAQPEDGRDRWMSRRSPHPENQDSFALREEINLLFPKANRYAQQLGVGVIAHSYPAPVVGGPVLPVNLFSCVIDRDQGHSRISKIKILDVIDQSIGTAQHKVDREFKNVINPIWWLVAAFAYFVRIPFLVLRAAGLPASVEEGLWAHIVKGVITALLLLFLAVKFGLKPTMTDVLRAVGR